MASVIILENVNKKFDDTNVISDFNLHVKRNEMVAIAGQSGAGKTTLLNIIGLIEKPTSGNITICGIKNPKLNSKYGIRLLRYNIGYLFQNYALVDDETVDFNLNLALKFVKTNDKRKVKEEALQTVGLSGFENKKIYKLSGGEQQRIAIARLLVKPCELILADEPTGSLDNENRNKILDLLDELKHQGKTILLVTHDDVVKKRCDRVIEIH